MKSNNELKTLDKIENYLGNGGLFNPELMEHAKVRDLIMDCREEIQKRDDRINLLERPDRGIDIVRGYINRIERLEYEYKAEINRQVIMGEKIKAQQKEIQELKHFIKEATPWVTCVKEITELPEYRQAIATKVLIEWLEKAEKIK